MKCLAVACMVFILAGAPMAQESPVIEHLGDSGNAWINWERQVIKAVGVGVLPGDAPNQEEAERLARQAAGVNAYRNIEAAIRMARVHDETLVGNIIPEVPEIRLKQLAHSAQVVSDRQRYDRSFEVILQVPLAKIVAVLTPTVSERHGGRSLLLDARELDVVPALLPSILGEDGRVIYSGPAKYLEVSDEDVCAPEVVKALEVKGLTDLVISNGDVVEVGQVTIFLSPTREPGKPISAPSPNRG